MTCDAGDLQGPSDPNELVHVADHERDVFFAAYRCLLRVLTGDDHQWDHVRDLKEIAENVDDDVRIQLNQGRQQSIVSPLARAETSNYPISPISPIPGERPALDSLACYALTLTEIRRIATEVRAGEEQECAGYALIRAELALCARSLGRIADFGVDSVRMEKNMRSTG